MPRWACAAPTSTRLVEQLQASMAAKGIAFADQNRMLALLAPMHRDIVSTR